MKIKARYLSLLIFALSFFVFVGCGSSPKYYLQENEINYFKLEETTDLSELGKSMNGTKDCIVALDADKASVILDSLASIGEVTAENLSMEFNLNGKGDYSQLSELKNIKGLASLTVAGENNNTDVSVYTKLPDLSTLVLKDQKISDYTPLSKSKSLKTLSLVGENIDYRTLTEITIEDIEIPVSDTNWVALELLKQNQGITTINHTNREQYLVGSSLEGEEHYYNLQFSGVAYASKKKQEITTSAEDSVSAITGTVAVVGTKNLLKNNYYTEQAMLKTWCGFSEDEENAAIFYPMTKDYTDADASASMINLAGTDFMEENFLTAVTVEDADYIYYVYALDKEGKLVSEDTSEAVSVYGQLYDIANSKYYTPTLILDTPISKDTAADYQNAVRNGVNEVLKGYPVRTL